MNDITVTKNTHIQHKMSVNNIGTAVSINKKHQ